MSGAGLRARPWTEPPTVIGDRHEIADYSAGLGARGPEARSAPPGARPLPAASHGFTYIGLLIFIALMGIALAGTGTIWHTQVRREKERELLFVGDQFRRAIGRYYERSPGADRRFPPSLDDLLHDPRFAATERHLRRVYRDPVSARVEWGLVTNPQGGIFGVYSLSEDAPLKRAGFPVRYEDFKGKEHYREWRFVYSPPAPPGQRQSTGP